MSGSSRRWLAAILLMFPALVFGGCGADNPAAPTNNEAPALPDQRSFAMDNSVFPESQSVGVKPGGNPNDVVWEDIGGGHIFGKGTPVASGSPVADSAGYSNYVTGRTVVGVVRAAVVAASAAPAAAFAGAFLATPVKQSDGSWTWSYSVVYGSASYDLALNGARSGDNTDWSMHVTTSGLSQNVSNFLWYAGQTQNVGRSGFWQVYDATVPSTPTNLLRVDWNRSSLTERTATWVNNRVGSPSYGDNLAYSENSGSAALDYAKASSGEHSFVHWDMLTTAGSVRIPIYNGGQEACWDSGHLNSSCAQ